MLGEFTTFRTTSLLDALYAVGIIKVQATASHEKQRPSGSRVLLPNKQKTACRAAFRRVCTLVEDVRTAVQENSDFLVPVQRLLDRVNREKGKATALLPVVQVVEMSP
jgi:hypothetical protein